MGRYCLAFIAAGRVGGQDPMPSGTRMEAQMNRLSTPLSRAGTLFGLQHHDPIARLMAGFTGFAVAVTLILASSIPVEAGRGVCATSVETSTAACGRN